MITLGISLWRGDFAYHVKHDIYVYSLLCRHRQDWSLFSNCPFHKFLYLFIVLKNFFLAYQICGRSISLLTTRVSNYEQNDKLCESCE